MSSKLVPAVQRALVAEGWAALRFNFRGVGRSEGSFGGGVDEVGDVAGALGILRETVGRPHAVIGWSFGALVALNAVAQDPEVDTFVGIAPPAHSAFDGHFPLPPMPDLDRWEARALLVCGTEDPFCRPDDLRKLSPPLAGAVVHVLDGADHFFNAELDELCALVAAFATGARATG